MKFHELETVVLERDIPERGVRKGDLGAIVEDRLGAAAWQLAKLRQCCQ